MEKLKSVKLFHQIVQTMLHLLDQRDVPAEIHGVMEGKFVKKVKFVNMEDKDRAYVYRRVQCFHRSLRCLAFVLVLILQEMYVLRTRSVIGVLVLFHASCSQDFQMVPAFAQHL